MSKDGRGLAIKHGYTGTSIYRAWQEMKYRCTTETCRAYKHYGARGITVCDRWLNSFENFLEDMGEKPSSKHSLDRIDNNGNYEPSNCRWATRQEQGNNKRDNNTIVYKGSEMTLTQLSGIIGIDREVLYKRSLAGTDLFSPIRPKKDKHPLSNIEKMINRHKEGMNKREAARSIGAHPKTFNALAERYYNEKN